MALRRSIAAPVGRQVRVRWWLWPAAPASGSRRVLRRGEARRGPSAARATRPGGPRLRPRPAPVGARAIYPGGQSPPPCRPSPRRPVRAGGRQPFRLHRAAGEETAPLLLRMAARAAPWQVALPLTSRRSARGPHARLRARAVGRGRAARRPRGAEWAPPAAAADGPQMWWPYAAYLCRQPSLPARQMTSSGTSTPRPETAWPRGRLPSATALSAARKAVRLRRG